MQPLTKCVEQVKIYCWQLLNSSSQIGIDQLAGFSRNFRILKHFLWISVSSIFMTSILTNR